MPVSPSLKRFAKQGLVYLSDIDTLEDLNELSVNQAKNILAMNRVNFKGVVEKEELLKIIERLWNQEQKAKLGKQLNLGYLEMTSVATSFQIHVFRGFEK